MFFSVFLVIAALFLVVILKIVSMLLAERVVLNREELSPYECGFEHHNVSRIPISLRYFMLTLLFLLFDLEVVFLLFLPSFALSSNFYSLLISLLFLLFLVLSLFYE